MLRGFLVVLLAIEYFNRFVHGDDVFRGNFGKYIVNGVEDKAASWGKNLQPLQDMPPHLSRCSAIEHAPRIAATAPKADVLPEFPLEFLWFHVARAGLNGVNDVIARFDEIRQKLVNRTAGVKKGFHVAVLLDVFA